MPIPLSEDQMAIRSLRVRCGKLNVNHSIRRVLNSVIQSGSTIRRRGIGISVDFDRGLGHFNFKPQPFVCGEGFSPCSAALLTIA